MWVCVCVCVCVCVRVCVYIYIYIYMYIYTICVSVSMCCTVTTNYTYIYTCGNKINNNDERTHFFRKIYLRHFIRKWLLKGCERVMCERWVGDWTNCNILTPISFVFSSTSFSVCWAAQSGVLRAHSPLLGADSLYSILSPIAIAN